MANRIEVSAEQAIGAVASYPRSGQIAEKVYIGNHPTLGRADQVVSLTAVWEGAERLSGESTVRCIVLENNPHLVGLEDAIFLRIDRVDRKGSRRFDYVYREGVAPVIGEGEESLIRTVLGNIIKLAIQP